MVSSSTTFVVGSLIVVTAFAPVTASTTLFLLITSDVRICGFSATRNADILWLVPYYSFSCSTINWMYTLLI